MTKSLNYVIPIIVGAQTSHYSHQRVLKQDELMDPGSAVCEVSRVQATTLRAISAPLDGENHLLATERFTSLNRFRIISSLGIYHCHS